jgi:juvenile hormone epoxide hydrolase
MGLFNKLYIVIVTIVVLLAAKFYHDISKPFPVPKVDINQYWGPGNGKGYKVDPAIKPFQISYSQRVRKLIKLLGICLLDFL